MTDDQEALPDAIPTIRRAIADGLNAHALDLVRRTSARIGEHGPCELPYLGALASARMGALAEAESWLARVDVARIDDPDLATDVYALTGRIAKDRYAATRDGNVDAATRHAHAAIDAYRRAFELGGAPYPGVNAATVARLVGDEALARTLAQRALDACREGEGAAHWMHATRGEALLLLGKVGDARREYALAREHAGPAYGDVAAMRRQLALIGTPAAIALRDALPAPTVIAFAGHMIDDPQRRGARFPAGLEGPVASALRRAIADLAPAIGFAQPACGADLLFLEAMQDAGLQTHVVLPCAKADFVESSVAFAGHGWVARFERALARATSTLFATDEPLLGDTVLFEHASNLIHGMARLRAAELETEPMLLAVQDAAAPPHQGGTAATVDTWRRRGRRVETIDLAALRGTGSAARDAEPPPPMATATSRSLKSLLFADVQGFSRLPEQYTPRFAEIFLGTAKRLLDALEQPAVDANTQGDGLYLVFERPADAAWFAIRLQRELARIDWSALGLPPGTRARVGLHTGPVFRTFDPVMGKPTFYGTHVNRTARLEPVVQPGHIFVTEAFAASLVADDGDAFRCHYIGTLPLAKAFGEARLYRLVARDD